MPLVVKKTDISENLENLNFKTFFDLIAARINSLNRLKDKETLSDDEFLSILDFCYTYDLRDLINDIITHPRTLFKSKTVTKITLDTNILLCNYTFTKRFIKYSAFARPSFKQKKIYTLEELESSILRREIIIDSVDYYGCAKSNLIAELKEAPKTSQETFKRADALIIRLLSLKNLGPYKDWLLPIIKKAFSKERVAKDILELVEYGKKVMASYKETLEQEKQAAEKIVADRTQTINELKKYNGALNRMLKKQD